MELLHLVTLTDISIVLVGTPDNVLLLQADMKVQRRFQRVELYPFVHCDEEFCMFLEDVREALRINADIGNPDTKIPELLHAMTGGLASEVTLLVRRIIGQELNMDVKTFLRLLQEENGQSGQPVEE